MNIELQQPFWLLLLPVAFAIVIWVAKRGQFGSAFQQKFYSVIRILVCSVLILAMAQPNITIKANGTTTIFAADRSASATNAEQEIKTFLTAAQEAKDKKDILGVLSFGRMAGVEQLPTQDTNVSANFISETDKGGTDIAAVLRLAASVMPEKTAKRVVLLSDGNETQDDGVQQARALAAQGIVVDVVPLQTEESKEVQLTNMELPKVINKNTRYDIGLQIDANIDTPAQIRLYKGNTLIAQETVSVHKGENKVVFSDLTERGGGVTYRAEIEAQTDTLPENNQVYAYTYITDVPQVLVIEQDQSGKAWEDMLSAQMHIKRVQAAASPVTIEQLSTYDGIILANVAVEHLPKGFLETLENYVRVTGGGVLVSGGENAFALGSYQNTILEEILPVNMDLKTEGQESDMTMFMVVDRSGSMSDGAYGITRMEMAKEAVIRSLDNFQKGDRVGVIAFDDLAEWAAEPQEVTENKETLTNAAGSIQLGGGTSILPALEMAVEAMEKEQTKQRHILLLTDGQAEQTGYQTVLQRMKEQQITLSTVAVGGDADTKLLEHLAEKGGGRYYFTDEFTDLPEIFAKETILAGKEFLNHRTFYPKQQHASAILSGVETVPSLDGYVGTNAKGRADMVLVSDKEEPILATWQYGLGRTAVWTADVDGQWSKSWLAADNGVSILRNTVAWTMKTQASDDMILSAQPSEKESILHLEMPFDETITEVSAKVVTADNQTFDVPLQMMTPGKYEGVLDTAKQGAYTANIMLTKKDGSKTNGNTGFYIGYPKEYDMTTKQNGLQVLQQIADVTGGRILTKGEDVFAQTLTGTVAQKELQQILLIVGLLLFLIDIALRRFVFVTMGIEQKWTKRQTQEQRPKKTKQIKKQKEPIAQKQPKSENLEKQHTQPPQNDTAQKLADMKKRRKNL